MPSKTYNVLEDEEVVERLAITAHYLLCMEDVEYNDEVDDDFEEQDEEHQAEDAVNGLLFIGEIMDLGCKITRKRVGPVKEV
jgi:hypothetical protein